MIFRKVATLFNRPKLSPPANDQALVVEVRLSKESEAIFERLAEFEERVMQHVETQDYGEFDGNEIAVDGSHARFYMYAPSADQMLDRVAGLFLEEELFTDASFNLTYGRPDDAAAKETTITLKQLRKMYDAKQ